jgi:hypothetical protein
MDKFLIATVAWYRPEILNIFLNINKKYCDILCVKSPEDSTLSNLKSYENIHIIETPNYPLGAKLNKRVDWFLNHKEYTHIIFLGSDDVLSPIAFETLTNYAKSYDLINWSDIYYYSIDKKLSFYSSGYGKARAYEPLAPGRCVSRKVLENIGSNLWDNNLLRGPDGNAWKKLKNIKNQITLSSKNIPDAYVIDIKSKFNIHNFNAVTKNKTKACKEDSENIMNLIETNNINYNFEDYGKEITEDETYNQLLIIQKYIKEEYFCHCIIESGLIIKENYIKIYKMKKHIEATNTHDSVYITKGEIFKMVKSEKQFFKDNEK